MSDEPKKQRRRLRRGVVSNVDLVWHGANADLSDGVGSKVMLWKSAPPPVPPRATGGPIEGQRYTITEGSPTHYLVGEKGAEILTTGAAATIVLASSTSPGSVPATIHHEDQSGSPATTDRESGMAEQAEAAKAGEGATEAPTVETISKSDHEAAVAKAVADAVAAAKAEAEASVAGKIADLSKSVEQLQAAAAERGFRAKAVDFKAIGSEDEIVAILKDAAAVGPEAYDRTVAMLSTTCERIATAEAKGSGIGLFGERGSSLGATDAAVLSPASKMGPAASELDTLVHQIATEKGIDLAAATLLAAEQRPELYEQFRNGRARQATGPVGA